MNKNLFIEESPLIYEGTISKEYLIRRYKEQFNVEVGHLLSSTDNISICRCKESGYRFYYPFEITGDSEFYEKLQENDWYYMPWKWEHQVCKKFIKDNLKILEIGCGEGSFLRKIVSEFENIHCVGLELNQSSIASEKNLHIFNETIEEFSVTNKSNFDIVCTFQVLEHVPTVNRFLMASISCLKDNGFLVISVPNNNSYIKYDKDNILNMPPHHMGLWTDESLKKIGEYYNLELVDIEYEPLQKYHFDAYTFYIIRKYIGKYPTKAILKSIRLLKLTGTVQKYLERKANKIKGNTVFIVFKKLPRNDIPNIK